MMSKRSKAPSTRMGARGFDPIEFLETTAQGRIISTHRKKQIILARAMPRTR
jgi:hypothetical protein